MMDPFLTHTGRAIVMAVANVNTDQIIPSREMKRVSKKGLSDGLFANLRYTDSATGGRTPNPDFLLNQSSAHGASTLIAGPNFGCGSSREHAVWALKEYGFRVLIAPGFGSIFRDNCLTNGVLAITLDEGQIAQLTAASHNTEVTANLEDMTLICGACTFPFALPEDKRHMLINGLSPIDVTLQDQDKIEGFRAADQAARSWLYHVKEAGA